MAKKTRGIACNRATDAYLDYPEWMPLAERESLAGEAKLTELRKQQTSKITNPTKQPILRKVKR